MDVVDDGHRRPGDRSTRLTVSTGRPECAAYMGLTLELEVGREFGVVGSGRAELVEVLGSGSMIRCRSQDVNGQLGEAGDPRRDV